jgi:hypothetical protein
MKVITIKEEQWFLFDSPKEVDECFFVKDDDYFGFVYALEFGSYTKIGKTQDPFNRIKSLKAVANIYGNTSVGRIVVSRPHVNFNENEHLLHRAFQKYRIRGEFFEIPLEKFLQGEFNLLFHTDSKMLNEKGNSFIETVKTFTLNRSHFKENNKTNHDFEVDDELETEWDHFEKVLTYTEKIKSKIGQKTFLFTCPRCRCSKARIVYYDNSEFNGGCPECDFQFRSENIGYYEGY